MAGATEEDGRGGGRGYQEAVAENSTICGRGYRCGRRGYQVRRKRIEGVPKRIAGAAEADSRCDRRD